VIDEMENAQQENKILTNKPSTTRRKVTVTSKKKVENEIKNDETKVEKPKKVMPPKPWLTKRSLKLKGVEESEPNKSEDNDIKIDILLPPSPCKPGKYCFSVFILRVFGI
jgi:hypothetical protein